MTLTADDFYDPTFLGKSNDVEVAALKEHLARPQEATPMIERINSLARTLWEQRGPVGMTKVFYLHPTDYDKAVEEYRVAQPQRVTAQPWPNIAVETQYGLVWLRSSLVQAPGIIVASRG